MPAIDPRWKAAWDRSGVAAMRRRATRALPQAAALVRSSRAAADEYGCSAAWAARTARRMRRRQAFLYDEALRVGALDPSLPEPERARLVSDHAAYEAEAPLNNCNEEPAFAWDKAAFYPYFRALGLPVPELLGILQPRASGWGARGRIITGDADMRAFVAEDLPERFVIKPAQGYQGVGVRLLVKRDDGRLLQLPDRVIGVDELTAELVADREFDTWIVQELVTNDAAMGRLGDPEGLDSVRVITLVRRDGGVEVVFAFLKLALGGGVSDNFLAGATGNGVAAIDVADGRLGPVIVPSASGIGYLPLSCNPRTGAPVEGVRLPAWREACDLVTRAAPHLLPSRAIGWDVAITPAGLTLIEANIHWLILPPGPGAREPYLRLCAESGVTPR